MKVFFSLVFGVANLFLTGLLFAKFWAWFLRPAIFMPEIGIWHGYGIGLVAMWPAMLVALYHGTKREGYLYRSFFSLLVTGTMFGFAALAKWLM